MMYLSDVSVFTLLTLLFFSLLFLPICWGRVSHQSWTSRMLTVCVPATEYCFVSSASNKPKRDLVDSPPASPTTPVGLSDTQQFLQHFFSYVSEASCTKTKQSLNCCYVVNVLLDVSRVSCENRDMIFHICWTDFSLHIVKKCFSKMLK